MRPRLPSRALHGPWSRCWCSQMLQRRRLFGAVVFGPVAAVLPNCSSQLPLPPAACRRHTTIMHKAAVPGPKQARTTPAFAAERYTRALVANTPWYANASTVLQQWRDDLFLRMQKQYAALEKHEYSGPQGEQKPIVR